eukprot:8260931-Ditylum_brightwellii.AAC.1
MRQLRHKYSAYLGFTSRDVLDRLMDHYGQIKPADLVENGMNYNKPMAISQPIDAYFTRIDDYIKYASDGKTPYTTKQIITTVQHAVQKTGWFKVGIGAWKAKDPGNQIWKNFKKDFARESDKIKEEQE